MSSKKKFLWGMCKMVVKIAKETWEKCGIDTICYYDKKRC